MLRDTPAELERGGAGTPILPIGGSIADARGAEL
jgi:hypothetical protein